MHSSTRTVDKGRNEDPASVTASFRRIEANLRRSTSISVKLGEDAFRVVPSSPNPFATLPLSPQSKGDSTEVVAGDDEPSLAVEATRAAAAAAVTAAIVEGDVWLAPPRARENSPSDAATNFTSCTSASAAQSEVVRG